MSAAFIATKEAVCHTVYLDPPLLDPEISLWWMLPMDIWGLFFSTVLLHQLLGSHRYFFSLRSWNLLNYATQLLIVSCGYVTQAIHYLLEGSRLIKCRLLMPYTGPCIRGPLNNADC